MKEKQFYAAPFAKIFKVAVEGNVCQALSNHPIDPYTGLPLGDDVL